MEIKQIVELLDKYYGGKTTLEEESKLKHFFQQDNVPSELQADRKLFLLYTGLAQQPISLPPELEKRLSANIDQWEKENQPTRRRLLSPSIKRWGIGIAACLLIGIGIGYYQHKIELEPTDTFDDPALAYQETQRTLQHFAIAFQKGEEQVVKVEETVHKVQQALENITTLSNKKQQK